MSFRALAAGILAALGSFPVWADEPASGGHIKVQAGTAHYRSDDLASVLGYDPAGDRQLDLRLKTSARSGAWSFQADYELLATAGDSLALRRQLSTLGLLSAGTANGLPDDRRRLFDLTRTLTDQDRRAAVHRLDRFSASYQSEGRTLRFGRQVVSWGNGLIFQVLDFVNPFSPVAIDKEYKTGEDMFYGQWLIRESDAQLMIVPRRDATTHDLESRESSYAAKWRFKALGGDADLLAARHYEENMLGVGFSRNAGGAVWRLDVLRMDLTGRAAEYSLVTNLDYSWAWGGRNFYGYVEYFRSGTGEKDSSRYLAPNAALGARLARGELYTLGRDYAVLGMRYEQAPLLNWHLNLIRNQHDHSAFWQVRAVYDWRQNLQLMAGVNLPEGERGTEYGGLATPQGFLSSGRSLYARLGYYF
ncbi:MAG: hypothetical protein A2140_03625 [Candidatus Muproteobacteria bacterium RBG_16_62_13]|uniref:Alginate export domain-containing protein n=1 Tax=Candidatus Muproteobacteria bacterium RBG_16_62_13 TaxID=1817756 RepID=A0A1F6T9A2_9PROT|nr:MAG: hypothetical protein A2140_03625 [Candidatus Muproteobacteria bacterium RBG_16_62_13]